MGSLAQATVFSVPEGQSRGAKNEAACCPNLCMAVPMTPWALRKLTAPVLETCSSVANVREPVSTQPTWGWQSVGQTRPQRGEAVLVPPKKSWWQPEICQ
jgi:hypothetical protein